MLNNQLPNLLIVGAAKSGTTSLHHYLNQHPDVFMSSHKEPHFLISNEIGKSRIPNGVSDFAKYKMLFNDGQDQKYRGESSVMYLSFPEIVIPNIKQFLGDDVKIIIMLRNPIDRAFSGYQHVKRYNEMENLSFGQALKDAEKRYKNNEKMTPASRYKEIGLYYDMVKAFQQDFKAVHIIIYDDYAKNLKTELEKVFEFLKLEKIEVDTSQRHMVGGWQWKNEKMKKMVMMKSDFKSVLKFLLPKGLRKVFRKKLMQYNTEEIQEMSSENRIYLKDYYADDVERLSILLDRDLNHWIV